MLIGLISDTHDLVRPEALAALVGCNQIIHAGDVCRPDVIAALQAIAPVTVVRGNRDKAPWGDSLPLTAFLDPGGIKIYVIHILADLDIDPAAAGVRLVISGHSHQAGLRERNGVYYLNPGSAGRRRFNLPVSLALLKIEESGMQVKFISLGSTIPLGEVPESWTRL